MLNTRVGNQREVEQNRVYKEYRTTGQQVLDALREYPIALTVIAGGYGVTWYLPMLLAIYYPALLFLAIACATNKKATTLPFFLPKKLKRKDKNLSVDGQRFKFQKANGVYNVGNELYTGSELWMPSGNLLQHQFLIGGSGYGKTEALLSIATASALNFGGALFFTDGKGEMSTANSLVGLARLYGREDDVRIQSFRLGGKEPPYRHFHKFTNTCAIFSQGTSSVLQQILEDMMPQAEGDNQYFRDKAVAGLKVLIPALNELRNAGLLNINPDIISQAYTLPGMVQIAYPKHYGNKITFRRKSTGEKIVIDNIVSRVKRRAMRQYLERLPEFSKTEEKLKTVTKQSAETFKQFSYGEGYIVKPLAELASTMSHMFDCEMGELCMTDTIKHNRLAVIIIPAVEASTETLKMQGKLVVSNIRIALSEGLGSVQEGDYNDMIGNLPVDKRSPTVIIIDEYAAITDGVSGFETSITQGRSLGCSTTLSNQDIAGFLKNDQHEAAQMFGSTETKILMKSQDVEHTVEWFKKLFGQMFVAESSGHEPSKGAGSIVNTGSASYKEVDVLNQRELNQLGKGEAYVMTGGRAALTKLYYNAVDYSEVKSWEFNRMLQVRKPTTNQLNSMNRDTLITQALKYAVDRQEFPETNTVEPLGDVTIGEGTDWIYKLIGQQRDGTSQANKAAKVLEEQKEQFQESITSAPKGESETSVAEPATTSDQAEIQTKAVKSKSKQASLAFEEDNPVAKNRSWLQNNRNSDTDLPESDAVKNYNIQLAEKMNINPEKAIALADKTVENLCENSQYTTIPIKRKSTDVDEVMRNLDLIDD